MSGDPKLKSAKIFSAQLDGFYFFNDEDKEAYLFSNKRAAWECDGSSVDSCLCIPLSPICPGFGPYLSVLGYFDHVLVEFIFCDQATLIVTKINK